MLRSNERRSLPLPVCWCRWLGGWTAASKVCWVLLVELRRWPSPAIFVIQRFSYLLGSHPKRVSYLLEFLPSKLSSRFLLTISSRQIDWSISIADFFPPNRGPMWPCFITHNRRSQTTTSTMTTSFQVPTTVLIIFVCLISRATAWSSRPGYASTSRRQMVEQDDDERDDFIDVVSKHSGYNVLGTELSCCCSNVGGSGIGTGFYRNGFCGKISEVFVFFSTVCL